MFDDATLAPARQIEGAEAPSPSIADRAAKPIENEVQAALAQCRIGAKAALDLLRKARDLDEPLKGGNTLRLTRLAQASLITRIDDNKWTMQELRNWISDTDAVILAAINVTDDEISEERHDLLTAAHNLMDATWKLIDDEAVKARNDATAKARVTFIVKAIREADRKIEHAYDKAEPGESLSTVLDHIAHELLIGDVFRMDEPNPTQQDAEATYEALFKPLAVLDSAIALARGTIFEPFLREAWQLLDKAQTACDPVSNKDLPTGETVRPEPPCDQLFAAYAIFTTAAAIVDSQWQDVKEGGGAYGAARALVDSLGPQFEAQASNKELTDDDCETVSADLSVIVDLLEEHCEEWDNQCLWGALYLMRQCKDLVDQVEFPKERANA